MLEHICMFVVWPNEKAIIVWILCSKKKKEYSAFTFADCRTVYTKAL